jgi:hypothetical protein
MNAIDTPVRRVRKETHTDDTAINQRDSIDLSAAEVDRENLVVVSEPITTDAAKMLAFMEEPVTIRIEKSSEKFAPKVVDCWVNGRGAEVFMNGKWMVLGFIPVGIECIVKRKYVEVIARSKVDNITTQSGTANDESPQNLVDISTSHKAPFSIIEDLNPAGRAWARGLMREQS